MSDSAPAPPRLPPDIVELGREALAAHRAGRAAEAEQHYRAILDAAPGHFDALHLLGKLYGQTGRFAEAIVQLRRAVALRPSWAPAQIDLGVALQYDGQLAAAMAAFVRAAEIDPNDATAAFSLATCHQAAGDAAAAVACYRRVIARAPGHAAAHNNLGNLVAETDPAEAEALLRQAIALDPAYARAQSNLGALLLRQGRAAEATTVLRAALATQPDSADAMTNLASALRLLGDGAAAQAMAERAVAAAPAALPARWVLAAVLAERGAGAAALAALEAALAVAPADAETRLRHAHLLHHLGHFAEAEAAFAPLAAAGPRRGTAWHGLVQTRRFTEADRAQVAAMAALAEDAALPAPERVALGFGLGKAYDDLGDYAAAMRHYDAGNALKRAALPRFDRAAHAAFVDRLIASWPATAFAARPAAASGSARPVLIVGMMRSGTTLVEQILAAHPDVAAGGELTFWTGAGGDLLPPADADAAAALVAGYTAELARIAPDPARVTDKLPHNFLALGLVHLLFPRARIVHCRRTAADTALSLYRTLFGTPNEFSYDQGDIVFFYRSYERLMAHWRAVLPAACLLDLDYESVVAGPEAAARALVRFCSLGWDARCLDHTANPRLIRTASAWQARQKVFADSAGKWRRYAPYLGELSALLPAAG